MRYVLSQSEKSEGFDRLLGVLKDRFGVSVSTMTIIETDDDIVWDIIEALGARPLPEPISSVDKGKKRGPKPGTKYKVRKKVAEIANATGTVVRNDGTGEAT